MLRLISLQKRFTSQRVEVREIPEPEGDVGAIRAGRKIGRTIDVVKGRTAKSPRRGYRCKYTNAYNVQCLSQWPHPVTFSAKAKVILVL